MCYWRRLSKRSIDDDSDFEYIYSAANNSDNTNDYGNKHDYDTYLNNDDDLTSLTQNTNHRSKKILRRVKREQPVMSDSLSLFKALQVRHELPNGRDDVEDSEFGQSKSVSNRRTVRDVFAEDSDASLVCYRYAEVIVFLLTIGCLLLLICSIAITYCLRLRKLTRYAQKQHLLATEHTKDVRHSLFGLPRKARTCFYQQHHNNHHQQHPHFVTAPIIDDKMISQSTFR